MRRLVEQLAVFYGVDADCVLHGPDGHVEGAFGLAIRARAVSITFSDGRGERQLVTLEGAGQDGSENDPGHLEFRTRDAKEIVSGRGARGPHGDYPPGS